MQTGPNSSNEANDQGSPPTQAAFRPLRTWPALFLVALMFAARFGPPLFGEAAAHIWYVSVFGPMLCSLLLVLWWLGFSRATWRERVFGFLGWIVSLGAVLFLVHPTVRGGVTSYLTVPMGMAAFAIGANVLRTRPPATRSRISVLLALLGFSGSLLLRNEGMTGDYGFGLHWRWSKSAEERMLANRPTASPNPAAAAPAPAPAAPSSTSAATQPVAALGEAEWPGFRGPGRDGRSQAPAIATSWATQPPRQLWKIPVGPAWSSFAVAGTRLFTQEQRGPREAVVCYEAATGRELWVQTIDARFDEPLGGPGPRATPTIAGDGLFVTGATGRFMRLNPNTGAVVWEQDLTKVAERPAPMWGFSASPLVVGTVAVVYAGGPGDKGLLAFDAATGAPRWSVAAGKDSYSSPQLATLAGESLVLMLTNDGLLGVDPATGTVRLEHEFKFMNYRALQAAIGADDTVLLPTGLGPGTRAIRVRKNDGKLTSEELWNSRQLKPDFTDLVLHGGHAYGNDGGLLTCIDLATGTRQWKGGRYGKGQILLLENSGLLLIAAEQGDAVLVQADPKEHREIATFRALEGKTWNHPVVVGDRLYLRNAQEAACYVLAPPPATTPGSPR